MNKDQIKSIIEKHDKDEEFYNSEYPDHKEALIEFLEANGVIVDAQALIETPGEPYIDADGYSSIDSEIQIPSMDATITIAACQHNGWDFHFKFYKWTLAENEAGTPLPTP